MANFISVVVCAYGVQGYLTECLDSVLGTPSTDVQVVGVDDASPDHGGEVLDERAAADPRLTVRHLDATGGPGPARNAGLEQATGDYVWFVDGDDYLLPGALEAVRDTLRNDPADVLVVGHTPRDVKAALGAGAVPVGVASHKPTGEQLADAGAEYVIESLTDGLPGFA